MKIDRLLIILVPVFLFSCGCSNHYYAPVLYNNYASYMPKPLSTDSVRSANYISGGGSYSTGIDGFHDNILLGQLDIMRASTFNGFNIAYGLFGFAGSYENGSIHTPDPSDFDTKSVLGLGTKASANFSFPLNSKVDFRLIGIEVSYSKEFGDYLDFRKKVYDRSDYHVNNNSLVLNGGLTTEIAWKGDSNISRYAIRGYLGRAFGNNNFSNYTAPYTNDNTAYSNFNFAASFFMDLKRYCLTFERQRSINFNIRFGYRF